jgi:hypothetical protein
VGGMDRDMKLIIKNAQAYNRSVDKVLVVVVMVVVLLLIVVLVVLVWLPFCDYYPPSCSTMLC